MAQTPSHEHSLDAVVTGGAGYYAQDSGSAIQPTANLDFFAQTSILDLSAGVHVGLSKPISKALTVGLRFPLSGTSKQGLYADADLLFFDKGTDEEAFATGIRAALAGRLQAVNLEYRLVGEARRLFSTKPEAWVGVELGFFCNLLSRESRAPTRKDSLVAELNYIATPAELETLRAASTDAQLDSAVEGMWRTRDLTPATPLNEARLEYERRVRTVDSAFGSEYMMGVNTDRGRVVLLYGEPNQIESAPSIDDPSRRYQMWVYEGRIKGYRTAIFLFQSYLGNSGDYRQIFSNIPGEPSEYLPYDLPSSMSRFITGHS